MSTVRVWLAMCLMFFLMFSGSMQEAVAAAPQYTVKIDQATTDGTTLSVSGSVTSSRPTQPATNVTIDVLPPSGSPIRAITNLPIPAKQTSPYSWSGSLPNKAPIPNNSQVRVTSNRQSSATAPIVLQSVPVISQASVQSAPTPPSGMKVTCMVGPNSPTPDGSSTTCPVVTYNGVTFWPFSYIDNRESLGLVGYKSGQVVSQQELPGARYVWKATVDTAAQTVTFSGQANHTASVPWAKLK